MTSDAYILAITIDTLFPNGISHYLIGGVLVGLGVALIYITTGIIPGASTFLESTLSYFSKTSRFQRYKSSRDWRVVFSIGIISGAALYALSSYTVNGHVYGEQGIWLTEVEPWRLLFGGVLVGIGTRLGKGCTSGHGVCGVGSASRTSIINVAVFVVVAIIVALVLASIGLGVTR